ncbi:MAG: CHASE2 domain-containing protein [Symploca sp. SIO1C4]|uniref:CHASE2 domain-containing protein n=1 Tax=Symploca sp. SIO1C4 TaxID=2607765 RepID=A0A6B3NGC9_9CYAN|nr:CHASE2 domain-containing protein [Symploca sp. SIO1C4]
MTSRIIFRLNIWQADKCCVFQLRCGEGQELSDTLEYPEELTVQYEAWRKIYLELYLGLHKKLRGRKLSGGDLDPSSLVDYGHELEEARAKFIDTFQRWLAQLREIREKIQNKIHTVAQNLSQSGEKEVTRPTVDIFIACNSIDLGRLPWEAWELVPEDLPSEILPTDILRIARIPIATRQEYVESHSHLRSGKPRILVVLGDNTGLDLDEDKQTVKALKRVAQLKFFDWQQQDGVENLKAALANEIADERGWDALFFMGHSNETEVTDGELAIAPNTYVSIDQIKDYLSTAKKYGLRFCLFNSCEGLQIANRLANLGLQVAVMREPIYDDVAHVFLRQFCQELARHEDVHNAMLTACWHLQHVERFVYPSAYLIPSFFSPYGAEPFRFERWGWRKVLRPWMPTRGEAIALGILLLFSVIVPVQRQLFDLRALTQAIYRDNTKNLLPPESEPVVLVGIDPASLREGGIDAYNIYPMDRSYIAKLVKQLDKLEARVIGIDYLFENPQKEKDKTLYRSITEAVDNQSTWFVFASERRKGGYSAKVIPDIASNKWSLQGDLTLTTAPSWELILPRNLNCEDKCPLAYQLTLAQILREIPHSVNFSQPQLSNQIDLQNQVIEFFIGKQDNKIIPLTQADIPLGLQPIIDFSIPPEHVYKYISARKLFDKNQPLEKLKKQIVLIAPGGYEEANDNFTLPLAIRYWNSIRNIHEINIDRQSFTGGEAHAYMIHHILFQHVVLLIPTYWVVFIAAIIGKMINLMREKQNWQQKKMQEGLIVFTAAYGIFCLQIYVSAHFLIPWFLPSVTLWIFVPSFFKKKVYA